jgi:hypothetical protein
MKSSGPISIPEDIQLKCDSPNEFEKFDQLFRAVIAVPKVEIDRREKEWKRARKKRREAAKR